MLKNPKKKNAFFKSLKILKKKKFLHKKNAFFIVLLIEEISLQPELSSPTRFRIQGGGGTQSVTEEG